MIKETSSKKYYYALGRRKNALATVKIYQGKEVSTINGKPFNQVILSALEQKKVLQPLLILDKIKTCYFSAKTKGGGVNGQKLALRLALARALVKENKDNKSALKKNKLLTRDERMVERKHTGYLKARKAPQYSKR